MLTTAMMLLVKQQLHILQTQLSEGTISRPPLPRKYRAGSKDIFTRVHMQQKTFVIGLAHISNAEAEIRRRLEHSLLVYDSELGGIPIAFHRLHLLMTRVKISYSPPVVEVPCSYEMLLFTPRPRALVSGTIVNFGNQGIDMLVFDLFNAQVKYSRDATPELDANDLQVGDVLEFRVRSLGLNGDHIFVEAIFDKDVKLVRRGTAQERAAVIAEQQQEQEEDAVEEEVEGDSNGHQGESTEEHGPEYDDNDGVSSSEEEGGRKRTETPEQPKKKKRRTH